MRRFDAPFSARYPLQPTALRRHVQPHMAADMLTLELAYRPPLDWHALVQFLADRAIAGVEAVEDYTYRRVVALHSQGTQHTGWLEVRPAHGRRSILRAAVSPSLVGVIPQVLARVERLFDLACDPAPIAAQLGALARARPGLRVPGAFDGFEIAVRAVLGQQITVRAARTLASRLATRFGTAIETPFDGLHTSFPAIEAITAASTADIARLGIVRTRANAVRSLAQAIATGGLMLEPGTPVEATLAQLRALPGIGEWTAQYIAMRALAWPDAFPHTDLGVRKALGEADARRVLQRAEAWRPWRAYAVMHLWHNLSSRETIAAPSFSAGARRSMTKER